MSENLLPVFQEAYRNLELLPLIEQKDLDKFQVNYGSEVIEELEQLVEDSPSGDGKIIWLFRLFYEKLVVKCQVNRQRN